jgi:AcrR family transcriptional regulator
MGDGTGNREWVTGRPRARRQDRAKATNSVRQERSRASVPYDERWRAIVAAAAEVFNEKGFEAASTAEIGKRVGMLKGSLYYYIETKEDLLYAVIAGVHEAFLANRQACEEAEVSVAAKVRMFIEGHVAVNAREGLRAAVFYRDFNGLSPERRSAVIAERDRYDRFLRGLIEQGQAEGSFRSELDPKVTSIAILAMMNHVFQWYQPGGDLTPEDVGRQYADLLLGSLVAHR